MRFSIILPSLLSDFPGAATGRDKKLFRAIESVMNQTFTDYELLIIADGCPLTEYIVKHIWEVVPGTVKLLSVPRKQLFSNTPRNTGIDNAKGEYIIYLDNDDKWGPNHLKKIDAELNGYDWVYFNDWVWNGEEKAGNEIGWMQRTTDCTQYGRCGTSNICHASRLNLRWIEAGYGHDFMFIQQLLKFENYKQISPAEYFVCHYSNGYCV